MDRDLSIFLSAPKDASPELLAVYLDEACAGDAELRLQVEALFAADGVKEAIVDHAPKIPGAGEKDVAEGEGSMIGPYKLLQKIGEGGFGDVYMADQLRPVKRRVALKIIKLGMDTRQVVARFEAERQALAMMDHPNIAKVHDAGATETGRPFFVMELVRGIPITDFCDAQNLDTTERLRLFIDVCHAVQHAHQKGVVHRDLKPSNVMVSLHDDKPVVKVIDFGVAKATQTDLTDKTLFTRFEQFIGTPAYMSPEQAQFSGLDIDTRSDIYTLGVLLYELLTDTTPFDSHTLRQAGHDEIRRIIKEDEPARPSARLSTLGQAKLTTLAKHRQTQAAKLPSLVRGDLDWIVMKALEKDRARRYDTANALASDVARHLANEPVLAAAPSARYRLSKLVRKHRSLITAAALIVTTLIVGAMVSLWQAIEARQARDLAQTASASEKVLRQSTQDQERVTRHRLAEEKFAADESALGIAHLARLIRDDDNSNTIAAERMLAAIRARPLPELLHIFEGPGVRVAKFSGDGSKVALGLRHQTVQVHDTETGKQLSPMMELSESGRLRAIRFSPDGHSVLAMQAEAAEPYACTAQVFDWKSGNRLCAPLRLDSKGQVVAFSPDGKLVLMGCPSKACVWDVETGQRCFDPIIANSFMGTFSPDSRLIAFSVGTIHDARSGELIITLPQSSNVYTVRFSPDGRKLVGASADGNARIWDVETGEVLGVLPHGDTVNCAEFSPDGSMIVTGRPDGTVSLWDAVTHVKFREFVHPRGGLDDFKHDHKGVSFSKNGRRLIGSYAGETWVWRIHREDAGTLATPQPRHRQVTELSPDNRLALTSGGIGKWDSAIHRIPLGALQSQLFRHPETTNWSPASQGIHAIDLSPDGTRLLTGGTAEVGVWDTETGKRLLVLDHPNGPKQQAAFSADGSLILTATQKEGVMVWDAYSGERLHHLKGIHRHAAFSPVRDVEGDYLLVAAPETVRFAQLYKARTGERIGAPLSYGGPPGYGNYLRQLKAMFSPDASRIVTTSVEGHARVWSVPDGKMLVELTGLHRRALVAARFSPDGLKIATASDEGTAGIWDAQSGELLHALSHGESLSYVAFSPDNDSVATSSMDGSVRVWDVDTGRPRGANMWHKDAAHLVCFSPDSRRLVTVSVDETARLWDASTGLPLSEPLQHDGFVADARFFPDGNQVVTAGTDTTARLWDLPPAPDGRVPSWVADWGEAVAGIRIEADGVSVRPVAWKTRLEAKEHVFRLPDDDYYAKTAKWYYADRETRPITPFSSMSLSDWVANRVAENTVVSLEEALQADPDHLPALYAIADLLENPGFRAEINQRRAAHYHSRASALIAKDPEKTEAELAQHALARLVKTASNPEWPSEAQKNEVVKTWKRFIEHQSPSQVLVESGSDWAYWDAENTPPPTWKNADGDDMAWESGAAPLGDGDAQTTLLNKGNVTYYFRHRFAFDESLNPLKDPDLTLRIRRDDGAIVYLNGREVIRSNMPGGEVGPQTFASSDVGGTNETQFFDYHLDVNLLQPGANLIAVEVHQVRPGSSDISFDLQLTVGTAANKRLAVWNKRQQANSVSNLDLEQQARVHWMLGQQEDVLQSLSQLLATLPDSYDPAVIRQRKEWQRRKADALEAMGRWSEAAPLRAEAAATPPRAPDCPPNQVDLSAYYTEGFFKSAIPLPNSYASSIERLAETFDPDGGPDFDLRGMIVLNSGIYASGQGSLAGKDHNSHRGTNHPDRVRIAVGQKAGAVHFLQACHLGRETLGVEVAHYRVHFEDDTTAQVPIIYGKDTLNLTINGLSSELLEGVGRFAWKQTFTAGWRGTVALTLQTWQNLHPDKTITRIDFVSAKKMAAPVLVGITLE